MNKMELFAMMAALGMGNNAGDFASSKHKAADGKPGTSGAKKRRAKYKAQKKARKAGRQK